MKKQKIFAIMGVIGFMALLSAPLLARAAFTIIPCGGYSTASTAPCTVNDFFYLVARIINLLISLAGVYAVLQIIIGGFRMVISQGNQEALKKAQTGVIDAIIGFVLVLAAFLIVNTLVNSLLLSKCPINLTNPQTYLTICS
jgi:hypothetical protein